MCTFESARTATAWALHLSGVTHILPMGAVGDGKTSGALYALRMRVDTIPQDVL